MQSYNTRRRLQPAERRQHDLQRRSTSSRSKPGTSATPDGLTADVIMRELNARARRAPRGAGVRLPAAGDPRRRHVGRRHLHARGPRRQGHRVPRREHAAPSWPRRASGRSSPSVITTFLPSVPQLFADVDRDKVLKQGVDLSDVYQTLQAFMGGAFVNYFNRFGRVWQVYVQAEGEFRTRADERRPVLRAEHARASGAAVGAGRRCRADLRPRVHHALQRVPRGADQRHRRSPGYSSGRRMRRSRRSSPRPCRARWASTTRHVVPGAVAAQGVSPMRDLRLLAAVVFLILAAQYESWSLPFSVLLGTPIAVFGAFAALWLRALREQRLRADRPGHADRPRRQERDPDRRVREGRARARASRSSTPRSPAPGCACARS